MSIDDVPGLEGLVDFFVAFLVAVFLALTAVFLVTVFLAAFFGVVLFLLTVTMILSCQLIVDTLVCRKQVATLRILMSG